MDHNIRKDVMKLITDAEFNEIGITNMGDKLILKKLILGSH